MSPAFVVSSLETLRFDPRSALMGRWLGDARVQSNVIEMDKVISTCSDLLCTHILRLMNQR